MAATLRLLRNRLAAPPPPPSPMLRSLFPASYSKAAAADDSLPAVCRTALTPPPPSLPRHYCRDVFPRKAPPQKDGPRCCTPVPNTVSEGTKSLLDRLRDLKAAADSLPAMCRAALNLPPPSLSRQYYRDVFPREAPPPKDEPRRCSTVPKITSDSTKSLLDQLKDLKDSMKALQDRKMNLEKHQEMISKETHDCMISNALFKVRLAGHMKLTAKIRQSQVGSSRMEALFSRLYRKQDEYDKDWAIQKSKNAFVRQRSEMVRKEGEDFLDAMRRCHELQRSIEEKITKVCAAVGLVAVLLMILAKII